MKEYEIKKIINQTPDTNTIFFGNNEKHPAFNAGQFITISIPSFDRNFMRAYSLSSINSDELMSVTVKRAGDFSNKLCDLIVGDKIMASDPYGFLFEDEKNRLVCIATGVGIAPIWSVIRSIYEVDPNRQIDLFYSNRTIDDVIFLKDISKLEEKNPNFKTHKHLTRQADNLIDGYIHSYFDYTEIITCASDDAKILVCGGQDFAEEVYKELTGGGIIESRISMESFFQKPWK